MTVRLRLQRKGTRKRPFYRVVAADQRAPRDGRYIEQLGTYDPLKEPILVDLDVERVSHWVTNGAEVTPTVEMLVRKVKAGETQTIQEFEAANRESNRQQREEALKGVSAPPAPAPAKDEAAEAAPAEEESSADEADEAAASDDAEEKTEES